MSDLIDRQAFIEQERKLYCEDCDRRKGTKNGKPNVICYEIGEAPCRSCWLEDALGDLEDFPAASPWHRVEDGLPKEVGSYLTAYCDGFVCENQWHYIGSTAIGWVNDAEAVRYWMPLPEPPKEDADADK